MTIARPCWHHNKRTTSLSDQIQQADHLNAGRATLYSDVQRFFSHSTFAVPAVMKLKWAIRASETSQTFGSDSFHEHFDRHSAN